MDGERRITLASMDPEKVACEIEDFIIDQASRFRRTGGIVGLSGGVDSTVTAALAKRAYDKYNALNEAGGGCLEVVGYMLPSNVNSSDDLEDAIHVAERLGIRYEVCEIQPVVEAFRQTNPKSFNRSYDAGNLMSEIRAVVLHGKSATENKSLIGTGNRDEDFGIGYYTLFGDGAVHMSHIAALPKRLVREMAIYLGFADAANRVPTAGLEPGQTDFRDIGYSYDAVEIATEGFMSGMGLSDVQQDRGLRERLEIDLEQYHRAFGERKFTGVHDAVLDIARRYNGSIQKGSLLSPPVAPVTLEYGDSYA